MLLYFLGFIFSIMGIIGYFIKVPALVITAFVYIIVEAIIGLSTGELRSVGTYVLAVIIGFFVAVFTKCNIFMTIAVTFCFEELVLGIVSAIFLVINATVMHRQSKNTKDVKADSFVNDTFNEAYQATQEMFKEASAATEEMFAGLETEENV